MKEENNVIARHRPSHRNKVLDRSPRVLEVCNLKILHFNQLRDLRTHLEQCSLCISGITDREIRIRPMSLDRVTNRQYNHRLAEVPIPRHYEDFSQSFHKHLLGRMVGQVLNLSYHFHHLEPTAQRSVRLILSRLTSSIGGYNGKVRDWRYARYELGRSPGL